MQKKSRISFGPGAASIILIVVILCMSILGLLSLINSRNDIRLGERSANVIKVVYELNGQAEHSFADLDALAKDARSRAGSDEEYLSLIAEKLPEKMKLEGNTVSWTEADEYRELECRVLLAPIKEEKRLEWVTHRMTMKTEETWSLGNF